MKKKFFFIKFTVTLLFLFIVYRKISFAALGSIIVSANVAPLFPFFILLFVNSALSAWKWRILLAADDLTVSFPRLFSSYLTGTFFNLFLPSSIGGDAYRVYSIGKYTETMSKSFASVFADRLSGFLALAIIGLTASIFGLKDSDQPGLIIIPLLLLTALLSVVALMFKPKTARKLFQLFRLNKATKLNSLFEKMLASFQAYRDKPRVLFHIMLISFTFQLILVIGVFVLAKTINIEIAFIQFLIFVPIITIMEAIPLSIFGVGFRDAGYALFFAQAGLPDFRAAAASMSLLYVACTVAYSSIGGVLFLFERGKRKPQQPAA